MSILDEHGRVTHGGDLDALALFRSVEILALFREFVLHNVTQWKMGAGTVHPIWEMLAVHLDGEPLPEFNKGPYWAFNLAENRETLAALIEREKADADT